MSNSSTNVAFALSPARRRIDQKIFKLSIITSAVASLLVVLVLAFGAYPIWLANKKNNLHALAEVKCGGSVCDTSQYSTDWQQGPDYLLNVRTGYSLDAAPSTPDGLSDFPTLDFSEATFIRGFREPKTYGAPDGETWRLYSLPSRDDGRDLEIFLGYAEKTPWKALDTPSSALPVIDQKLKTEAQRIAESYRTAGGQLNGALQRQSVDGMMVVDSQTGQILVRGLWLPNFVPRTVPLPRAQMRPYLKSGELYIVQADSGGDVLAVSLVPIGNIWWLILSEVGVFVGVFIAARALCRRFLRHYLAVAGVRVPKVSDSCHGDEGQFVEFKRGVSDEEGVPNHADVELLKSIAAFANTNDGLILIGVDDSGKLRGLRKDHGTRDKLEQKIHQLVRAHIRPTPPIRVNFEEVDGLMVCAVTVAHGAEPLYVIGGVIYVRHGSADVQAQPEQVMKMVTAFA